MTVWHSIVQIQHNVFVRFPLDQHLRFQSSFLLLQTCCSELSHKHVRVCPGYTIGGWLGNRTHTLSSIKLLPKGACTNSRSHRLCGSLHITPYPCYLLALSYFIIFTNSMGVTWYVNVACICLSLMNFEKHIFIGVLLFGVLLALAFEVYARAMQNLLCQRL